MMKKKIPVCIICILLLGTAPLALAEQTDIFYYTYNIEELNDYLENKSAERFEKGSIRFLEFDRDGANEFVAKDEEIDPAEITHGYNEIWCDYRWTAGQIVEFLKSENKADYLKNLEVIFYHVPMYYKGKRTTIEQWIEPLDQEYLARTSDPDFPDYQEFVQKDKLLLRMAKEGLSEYTPIHFINYQGYYFVAAVKDNTCFLIYMPTDSSNYKQKYAKLEGYKEFDQQFGGWMEQQVMTIKQAEQLLPALENAINKRAEIVNSMSEEELLTGNLSPHRHRYGNAGRIRLAVVDPAVRRGGAWRDGHGDLRNSQEKRKINRSKTICPKSQPLLGHIVFLIIINKR